MDPVHSLQDPIRNSDINQHPFQLSNSRNHDLQHIPLTATNILMDERGENILSSLLTSQNVNDIPVTNDTNFLLAGDNPFPGGQILMEPSQVNKYSYDTTKDSNIPVNNPMQVNNSPVKKALDKAKQSPFKKRGNFEEEASTIVPYPKSDSKDYSHSDLPKQLMAKMFGLLKEGLFCDSVILSGNTEIRVHKLVLLSACPFILSMITEHSQNASLKIELPQGIPLDVTSQLVHYLYDGKVTLTSDNVSHFARVANLFKLTHLIDMCKDFVIMFGMSQSILLDNGKDVIAILKNESESQSNVKKEIKKSPFKKTIKKLSKGKTVSLNRKVKDESKDGFTTSTPSHSYGTRRASMKTTNISIIKNSMAEPENSFLKTNSSPTSESFPPFQSKHPIHTNAAFINSNRIKSKVNTSFTSDAGMSETGSRITQSGSSEQTGSATSDSGLYNISSINSDRSIENVEPFENIEDLSDDVDADWKPHTKLKGKTFTKKGRAAKAFKKSYASFIKSAKTKKTTVIPPEQKETYTLRPPPKKRAKEFARTEYEELEDILSRPAEKGIVHTFSMETKVPPQDTKQRAKRTQRLMKASSYRASQLSAVVAQIEQKADHLPENERHFICDICGNHYIFSKRAVTHIISVHDTELEDVISALSIRKKEKVLKRCDICGYETKEPNFFYIHFHRYFRHSVPLPKGMQPFKCEICGKECFTRFQLKDHKLIHQEGTPFICENCGQGFNSRTCLTSHVFHKHSKIRNHKCTDYGCDKSFKTRTQLLVHNRSHTGEKPFQCPDCQYKSTTRGNLRLHLTNKHKHKPDIVKNIMINLKPTQGDELTIDLEADLTPSNISMHIITEDKQPHSYSQNITTNQEPEQIYSNAPGSHGNQSNELGYATVANIIASSEQLLYDNSVPENRPVNVPIQQYTTQQSLILNNIGQDQLDLLPSDQNLHTVQNSQGLVPSDNLQQHIILQDPHNTDQNESRMLEINRIAMQEARSLLQQQGQMQTLSSPGQNDLQHQRLSLVQDTGNKPLPQLVEVQEIHPVFLQDPQNNVLQYANDEDQDLLRNNGGNFLQKNSSNQGQIYLSTSSTGNQSHQNLPKIQIRIQDRGQLESAGVHGLAILSPKTSHSATSSNQDNRHQMELLQASQAKVPAKMYLLDVNNLAGVEVDSVTASVEQSQVTNTAPSIDNTSTLSQPYNDPQLLYQLYQQYNQSFQ